MEYSQQRNESKSNQISISKQKQFEIVDNQFIDLRTYQETKISNESFSFLGKKTSKRRILFVFG